MGFASILLSKIESNLKCQASTISLILHAVLVFHSLIKRNLSLKLLLGDMCATGYWHGYKRSMLYGLCPMKLIFKGLCMMSKPHAFTMKHFLVRKNNRIRKMDSKSVRLTTESPCLSLWQTNSCAVSDVICRQCLFSAFSSVYSSFGDCRRFCLTFMVATGCCVK